MRVTENGEERPVGEGLWKTAGALGQYRVTAIDPDNQAAAVQTVVRDGDETVQLLVRLQVKDGEIAQIETLIARKGDTCCWALEMLDSLSSAYDARVPRALGTSRSELVAAADAYFTALHTAGTPQYKRTNVVGVKRYENGKLTTNVPGGNRIIRNDAQVQLDSGMFGRIAVVNRRYPVIDVEMGTVLGIVVFEYPESKRPAEIISEMFKIEGGLIREIRAVQVKRASTGWQ